jgi:hypothetical protein
MVARSRSAKAEILPLSPQQGAPLSDLARREYTAEFLAARKRLNMKLLLLLALLLTLDACQNPSRIQAEQNGPLAITR